MGGEITGVVLVGMGGPRGPADVEPFLESLLSDPAMLPLPGPVRRTIARLIARRRGRRSRERYALMGGGCPIHEYTGLQVEALGEALGEGFVVRHAFRYSEPRAPSVCSELAGAGVRRIVALSTYPQRSRATVDSSIADLEDAARAEGIRVAAVRSYPDDPGFIRALRERTLEAVGRAGRGAHIVMAAHSLPRLSVLRGDPYVAEVERTASALERVLPGASWHLAYQSRHGPVGWVGPGLVETLRRIGSRGVRSVVVVPISFTSEHIETLVELDVEARQVAAGAGIRHFARVPVPGLHPAFLGMLARLAREEAERG